MYVMIYVLFCKDVHNCHDDFVRSIESKFKFMTPYSSSDVFVANFPSPGCVDDFIKFLNSFYEENKNEISPDGSDAKKEKDLSISVSIQYGDNPLVIFDDGLLSEVLYDDKAIRSYLNYKGKSAAHRVGPIRFTPDKKWKSALAGLRSAHIDKI